MPKTKEKKINEFVEKCISNIQNLKCPVYKTPEIVRSYSLSEVVGYRRCRKQYGFIKSKQFVTPNSGEFYFGTLIHQVLERAHRFYHDKGKIPDDDVMKEITIDVSRGLKLQGIRPLSYNLEERAANIITIFNHKLGEYVYPQIIDTEHKLQIIDKYDKNNKFILHGVVDVIKKSSSEDDGIEIWDYKGSRIPELDIHLKDYILQMQVYTYLFQKKNNIKPKEAVLVFIGEIDKEDNEKITDPKDLLANLIKKPSEIGDKNIKKAMNEFKETVKLIEGEYLQELSDFSLAWKEPDKKCNPPPKQMCETCWERWSCKKGIKITHSKI